MPYNIKLLYYANSVWNYISTYCIDSDNIMIFQRNSDYTPVIAEFSIEVSWNCPFTIQQFDSMMFYFDDSHQYSFEVSATVNNYARHSVNVKLKQTLGALQLQKIGGSSIVNQLQSASDPLLYKDIDNQNFANYQLLWVLRSMFTVAGLTLDTSGVMLDNLGTFTSDVVTGEAATVRGQDLRVDHNMLLLFGTDYVCSNDLIWEGDTNRKTFWEYISAVCSVLGWIIVPDTSLNAYKLLSGYTMPAMSLPPEANIYDLSDPRSDAKALAAAYTVATGDRASYYNSSTVKSVSDFAAQEVETPRGQFSTINLPNSFRFMFHDKRNVLVIGNILTQYAIVGYSRGVAQYATTSFWQLFTSRSPQLNRDILRDAQIKKIQSKGVESDLNLDLNNNLTSLSIDLKKRRTKYTFDVLF